MEDREIKSMVAETLTGDMRDHVLDIMKHAPNVWQKMSEAQQRDAVINIEERVESVIKEAVSLISSRCNQSVIQAQVEKVENGKDNIKTVLKVQKSCEYRHELFDAQGDVVLLTVTEVSGVGTEKTKAEIDKDEPSLFDQTAQGQTFNDEAEAKNNNQEMKALPAPIDAEFREVTDEEVGEALEDSAETEEAETVEPEVEEEETASDEEFEALDASDAEFEELESSNDAEEEKEDAA
jgi:hypothetical protein